MKNVLISLPYSIQSCHLIPVAPMDELKRATAQYFDVTGQTWPSLQPAQDSCFFHGGLARLISCICLAKESIWKWQHWQRSTLRYVQCDGAKTTPGLSWVLDMLSNLSPMHCNRLHKLERSNGPWKGRLHIITTPPSLYGFGKGSANFIFHPTLIIGLASRFCNLLMDGGDVSLHPIAGKTKQFHFNNLKLNCKLSTNRN